MDRFISSGSVLPVVMHREVRLNRIATVLSELDYPTTPAAVAAECCGIQVELADVSQPRRDDPGIARIDCRVSGGHRTGVHTNLKVKIHDFSRG
jgi:hypothetical protein